MGWACHNRRGEVERACLNRRPKVWDGLGGPYVRHSIGRSLL